MCSLAFFPRILQNDVLRVQAKLNKLQTVDSRKGSVLPINKHGQINLEDVCWNNSRRNENSHGYSYTMRRCYHSATYLPTITYGGLTATANVNPQTSVKESLVERCKNFASVFSMKRTGLDEILTPSEQITAVSRDAISDASLHHPTTPTFDTNTGMITKKEIDNLHVLKCSRSERNAAAIHLDRNKNKSVFKDVLAVFPLALPRKNRKEYKGKKKDDAYSKRMKQMEEMWSSLHKAGYIHEADRAIIAQQFGLRMKRGQDNQLLPEVDKTTQAMLDFMKDQAKMRQGYSTAAKKPSCLPPLVRQPFTAPIIKPIPPPFCPRPRPSKKPKSK